MEFANFAAPSFQEGAGLREYWRDRLKPAMKKVGKHALRLGARVAQDVLVNKVSPRRSLANRASQSIKEIQSGKGSSKKKAPRAGKVTKKRKVSKKGVKKRTVFD